MAVSKEFTYIAQVSRKTFSGGTEQLIEQGAVRAMSRRTALRVAMDKVLYRKSADIDYISVKVEEA